MHPMTLNPCRPARGLKRLPLRPLVVATVLTLLAASGAQADAIDDAIRASESNDRDTANGAIMKLVAQTDTRAAAALARLIRSGSKDKRAAAASMAGNDMFGTRFHPDLIDPLLEAARNDPEAEVRKAAVFALQGYMAQGGRRDLSIRRALITALDDRNAEVRAAAAQALYLLSFKHGASDFLQAVLAHLNDPSPAVRLELTKALDAYRNVPQVATALMPLANDPHPEVREAVRRELSRRGVQAESLPSANASAERQFDDLLAKITPHSGMGQRKALLALVPKLSALPPLPDEATRQLDFGLAAVKIANRPADYKAAEQHFQNASALAPWWAAPYYNLGVVSEKQGDAYSAREFYELYLAAAPTASDAGAVRSKLNQLTVVERQGYKVDEFINRAADAYNRKDYAASVQAAREAIALSPDNGQAHALLGSALSQQDKFKEAVPELQDALRLGHREPFVFADLAFSLKRLGSVRQAIETYERGLQEHPDYAFGWQTLGTYYNEAGDKPKALAAFEKALSVADETVNKSYLNRMVRELKAAQSTR